MWLMLPELSLFQLVSPVMGVARSHPDGRLTVRPLTAERRCPGRHQGGTSVDDPHGCRSLRRVVTVPLLAAITLCLQSTVVGAAQSTEAETVQFSTPERAESAAKFETRAEAVQFVIDRALAQLGVRYSWGGGNADGPTRGVRDGGVADAHGDYREVGFDCSGLMIYAFAPVIGRSLPHYSGAQFSSGPRVPLAAKEPGDMLFWTSNGRINHVALYIGNEKMIEAPYSGGVVRVTSMRYGDIVPHATRLL